MLVIYNLVWAPVSKINFNVGGVWNSPEVSGGKVIKERKSMFILIYLGINLFFGCLGFYNSDNKKKANCVMGFGIIYLIYNFVRSVTVFLVVCFRKEEYFLNRNILDNICSDLNATGEEIDLRSEDVPIKNLDDENNINNEKDSNEDNHSNKNNDTNEGEVREVEVEEE